MKNIFYLLFFFVFFTSCKSNTKKNGGKDTVTIKKNTDKAQSLISEFKPIIQGSWVNRDFINKIAKTQSPYLAKDDAGNICTMLISTKFIEGDSLKIEVGYGTHEGGDFTLKFHQAKVKGAIIAYPAPGGNIDGDTYGLKYKISKNDTTLILYTFNKDGKTTDSTYYFKVFNDFEGHELGYSLYYMVNKTLISGNYILTDSVNNKTKVSFDSFGNVSGFPNAKTYAIDVDFETPPGNNMDQLNFELADKKTSLYAFKIDRDTVNLYQTSFDKDSIDFILGKRIYKLIKQR
jgi:hypothetical protein